MITAHKVALLAARPRVETTWTLQYPPGLHTGLNGERIFATPTELHYLDEAGQTVRTEPNGFWGRQLVGGPLPAKQTFEAFDVAAGEAPPPPPKKNGDDAILETYLNHRGITDYDRRDAETAWAVFKELTNGKPLKDATRDDGRALVKYFQDRGNKRATIERKVGWLRAAVRLAIDEDNTGKLRFNPFSNIIPKGGDELDRLPLDDDDMKACKRNLDTLSESDQLLFRVLASTGMRLSEAFEIAGEATEKGCRFVLVGEKTEASRRRVPLPSCLLPFLPKPISGHMFGDDTRANHRAASKRFGRFLNDSGITDPRKCLHSLRHRAQDRLRAAGCPQDIREALLGHSKLTVGESYGTGFPVRALKQWADKIGF